MAIMRTAFRARGYLLVAILVGCGPRATSATPGRATVVASTTTTETPSSAPSVVPTIAPTIAPTQPSFVVVKGDAKLLPKEFAVLPPITFKPRAAAVTRTLLHGDRKELWYAPDGTAFASYGNDATIFAPGSTKGVAVKVADPLRVVFAPDSKYVAVMHARAPLSVFELPSGKIVHERTQGRECAAGFLSSTKIAFHDETRDDHGRLWHLDLTTGKAVVLPGERRATECAASPDGKRFLTFADSFSVKKKNVVSVVDGETGDSGVVFDDVEGSISFSPKADRTCFFQGRGFLFCAKVGVAQLERLTPPRANSDVPIFDDSGRRAVFLNNVEAMNGTFTGQWWLADFEAGTVRHLVGVGPQGPTTSIEFLAGGKRIAAGGTTSVRVWDLDAATMITIPGNQSWTVHPVASDPNMLGIGEEYGGSQERLWLAKLPP